MTTGYKPSKCIDRCPLADRDDLDAYEIALSLNCPGPRIPDGEVGQEVNIRLGGVAQFVGHRAMTPAERSRDCRVTFTDPETGDDDAEPGTELVCVNRGVIMSINAALNRGKE